ncbi:hypothetical protein RHSIM_Rhsim08G0164100 [Rhododendron simsii]|uniref:Uncharacterized protein n=1 Tax=Rhododendron simsii TaxID=118357 RepID=A0A834LDC8_RHOSS|nr:hypothetical protein RHSIM_Rhsim08G0164100 [Rhododendron simsii]
MARATRRNQKPHRFISRGSFAAIPVYRGQYGGNQVVAMDADEVRFSSATNRHRTHLRLTALKRAYADIILNTAKEAAARIMVSERKAVRFQHELGAAKEQGLQMLLRLKQMLDAKGIRDHVLNKQNRVHGIVTQLLCGKMLAFQISHIAFNSVSEAEMTYMSQQKKIKELEGQVQNAEDTMSVAAVSSLSQQRKIEELEAQLHEAEDIVKDLREELRDMQAELERVRKNKLQHSGDRDTAPQAQTSHADNGFHNSQSVLFSPPASRLECFSPTDMKNSDVNQRDEVYKCYNGNEYVGNSYIGKPDFPFISEENKLDISQPIVFHPPEPRLESFTASDLKSSAFNQRNEAYNCHKESDSRMVNAPFSKPDLPSIVLRSKEPELYRNRRTQRIRAFEEKLMAGELSFSNTVDDATYETSGREDGEIEGICKTPTYKADNMRTTEKKGVQHLLRVSRRKRRRFTTCKKNKTPSSRYLSNRVVKRDQSSDINGQSGGDPSYLAPVLSTNNTDNGILLKCTKVTESDTEFVKTGSGQNTTNKDRTSTDNLLLTELVSGSAENLGVPIFRRDVERVDAPVVNSETKTYATPDGIPNKPVPDRIIKYTFQRKRKKESLSSPDGNANAEGSILKKKTAENGPVQMEKVSSITESSRDSRRVAQVARQVYCAPCRNFISILERVPERDSKPRFPLELLLSALWVFILRSKQRFPQQCSSVEIEFRQRILLSSLLLHEEKVYILISEFALQVSDPNIGLEQMKSTYNVSVLEVEVASAAAVALFTVTSPPPPLIVVGPAVLQPRCRCPRKSFGIMEFLVGGPKQWNSSSTEPDLVIHGPLSNFSRISLNSATRSGKKLRSVNMWSDAAVDWRWKSTNTLSSIDDYGSYLNINEMEILFLLFGSFMGLVSPCPFVRGVSFHPWRFLSKKLKHFVSLETERNHCRNHIDSTYHGF